MDTLSGKTVLISGASEGIGRALALALAPLGANLALNARNAARLEETARACAALGAQVVTLPGDVSRQPDCSMLASRTVERFGGIDALVNNAGITMWSRFDAVSDLSVFERLLAVNYLGVLATPAENALLARYTPAEWRATAYGAKFLLALGVSTIGVKLVAVTYDATGNFAALWFALAGCAAFVALAGLFLPDRLRRLPGLAAQPAG